MPSTPKDPFAQRPTDKPQLTIEEVRTMHPHDLAQAQREGRCRDVAAKGDPERQRGYAVNSRPSEPRQGKDHQ